MRIIALVLLFTFTAAADEKANKAVESYIKTSLKQLDEGKVKEWLEGAIPPEMKDKIKIDDAFIKGFKERKLPRIITVFKEALKLKPEYSKADLVGYKLANGKYLNFQKRGDKWHVANSQRNMNKKSK